MNEATEAPSRPWWQADWARITFALAVGILLCVIVWALYTQGPLEIGHIW